MKRRSQRIELDLNKQVLLKYRIVLLVLSIGLIWASAAFSAESFRRPKSMSVTKRAQFAKRSEWIETKFKDNEEFHSKKADLLSEKRRRLVVEIEKVLKKVKKTPNEQRKNYTMRLAQYYLEDYYYELGKAYQVFDEAEKAGKKPTLSTTKAENYLANARNLYMGLLRDYPNDKSHDEMLYFYALVNLNQNRTNEAIATFEKLRTQHPRSKYTPDATAQLGDYYFEKANFKKSEEYYDALLKLGYKPLLPYAIYKKAWCEYKDARLDQSLNHFKWVILNEDQLTMAVPMQIKREALNDITLPYADLGEINPPLDFFRSQGPANFRRGIETIANIWQDKGRYKESTHYYEELLAFDILYVKNGEYEQRILDGLIRQNRLADAVERTFAALPRYLEGSAWHKANASKPEAQEQMALWEDSTRKLALLLHSNNQTTKSTQSRALAIRTYESYLQHFSNAPEATNLRNNLATLLFKEGEFVKAAGHYVKVYKDSKQEPQKQEALSNAFVSYNEQMNQERKSQGLTELTRKSKGKISEETLKETPFSDTENKFMKLGDLYVSKYPKATDAPEVMHEVGYVQYAHRSFEDALHKFRDLVNNYPNHEMSISASYLVLDILNQLKDYEGLIATCKGLLKSGPPKKEFRENVARVLRQTELKRIALLEEKKEYQEAAKGYITFSQTYGAQDKALHETALYNAAQNFYKAEAFWPAVETQELFVRTFPRSEHASKTRLEIARMYEQFGQYSKAAPLYESFAMENPKHAQARNALRMAGLLYWGAGQTKKAEALLISLGKTYPKDAKLAESDLLEIYESTGQLNAQLQIHLSNLGGLESHPAEAIKRKMAVADLKTQKSGRVPASILTEVVKLGEQYRGAVKKNPAAIDAYSKAKLWSLLSSEHTFRRLKFRLPQAKLEQTLKTKINMMKELETEYQKISRLGSPSWGLGAMYKTGRLYSILATDIEQAPLPPELKGAQLDMYRSGIKQTFVEPFRKKALSFAEACLAQAEKLMILSAWTDRCYSLASGLDDKRFPKVRTFYLPPVQMALVLPDKDTSKIELGGLEDTEHPFYSPLLYKAADRAPASTATGVDGILLSEEMYDVADGKSITPIVFSYRNLQKEQQEVVQRSLSSEKPKNDQVPTFSYLNSLRLYSPRAAVTAIQDALKKDPNNAALSNLLAMAFLDQENYAAAKVTWLTLTTRAKKTAGLLNNMGVLALQENRENRALKYFNEAHALEAGGSASMNLGFMALRNHVGKEALKYFDACIALNPKMAPAQVGRMVAMIQTNEAEALKTELQDLTLQYKTDPYARLSVSYYLLDGANDPEMARQILTEYLKDRPSTDQDLPFKRALDETGRMAQKDKELISQEELNSVEASLQ